MLSALAALGLSVLVPVAASAQSYLVTHSLDLPEGNSPRSTLVQDATGVLYGTAVFGGAHGNGSVFKLDPNGDNFLVIHSFDGSGGDNPYAGLILGGGFLFGTTSDGGTDGAGVIS
jgi:uncharacterized repeat protein (TIGR03803 family)